MPTFARLAAFAAAAFLSLPFAAQASEQKFAIVDLQRVLLEVNDGKAAKARLQKWLDDQQKLIDQEQQALRQEKERLDKLASAMGPDAYQTRTSELQRKVMALAQKWESARAEAANREQQEMTPIIGKIDQVIAEIAAREGLALVFDKKEGGLVFAQAKYDITQQVIRAYDAAPKK